MNRYQAVDTVYLYDGVIDLSNDQLATRRHLLIDAPGGGHKIIGQVCLKRGEEFGYDGTVSKSLADKVEVIKKRRGRGKAKAKPFEVVDDKVLDKLSSDGAE